MNKSYYINYITIIW